MVGVSKRMLYKDVRSGSHVCRLTVLQKVLNAWSGTHADRWRACLILIVGIERFAAFSPLDAAKTS